MPESSQALRARRAAARAARQSRSFATQAFDTHYVRSETAAVWAGEDITARRPRRFDALHRAKEVVYTPVGWAWAVGVSAHQAWFLVEGEEHGRDWVRADTRLSKEDLVSAIKAVLAQ